MSLRVLPSSVAKKGWGPIPSPHLRELFLPHEFHLARRQERAIVAYTGADNAIVPNGICLIVELVALPLESSSRWQTVMSYVPQRPDYSRLAFGLVSWGSPSIPMQSQLGFMSEDELVRLCKLGRIDCDKFDPVLPLTGRTVLRPSSRIRGCVWGLYQGRVWPSLLFSFEIDPRTLSA